MSGFTMSLIYAYHTPTPVGGDESASKVDPPPAFASDVKDEPLGLAPACLLPNPVKPTGRTIASATAMNQ